MVEFRILGALEAFENGAALQLAGGRPRALLAMLLLRANEVVSVDRLIDGLWGDTPPETARKAVQVYVVQLRRVLGDAQLLTRGAGYALELAPDQLDLARFERLVRAARHAEPAVAVERLREALALWRGPPLADFTYDAFAQPEIARLEELRVAAVEARVDADLALGRSAELVAELEALCRDHPLRERLRGHLMIALYRAGRQADALAVYREGRRLLDEELGLEPGAALQELERAILRQDVALAPDAAPSVEAERSVLVAPSAVDRLDTLLAFAEPLARWEPSHELIVAAVVEPSAVPDATRSLRARRDELAARGTAVRVAAFASGDRVRDLVRLAQDHETDLLILDAQSVESDAVLTSAPSDVAIVLAPPAVGPVLVPFGAAENDWAALELGAWIVQATGAPLRILGALGTDVTEPGASRLLADASLILQRVTGIVGEPWLAEPGLGGLAAAAHDAGLLVVGLSDRFATEGLGPLRSALLASPPAPLVFVRRGPRPGGLAPRDSLTRYTWSLGGVA